MHRSSRTIAAELHSGKSVASRVPPALQRNRARGRTDGQADAALTFAIPTLRFAPERQLELADILCAKATAISRVIGEIAGGAGGPARAG